jgi:hypothetical protein
MNQQRIKWHTNRDKPTTLNPSRRRRDFRALVNQFTEDLGSMHIKRWYTRRGIKIENRCHNYPYPNKGTVLPREPIIRQIVLSRDKKLIQKKPSEVRSALDFAQFVKEKIQQSKEFEVVNLKTGKEECMMQYAKRPSLTALILYLRGHLRLIPYRERTYCARLVSQEKKAGITPEHLLKKAVECNEKLFDIWFDESGPDFDLASHYDYFSTNIIAFGTNKAGNLKIGIVDI